MATNPVKEEARLNLDEIEISPVTTGDLLEIANGYYAAFPDSWHDSMEPPAKRGDTPLSVRAERFAKRMTPWLSSPYGKWSKATVKDGPNAHKIVGHAGWLIPQADGIHVFHHWRREAPDVLGWKRSMGWTDHDVEAMWAHVDVEAWKNSFNPMDYAREQLMKDEPHWFLAPLWVLPEYQGRGVSSLLLKEVLDLADAVDPPTTVYLESLPTARKVYEHFGFEGIEGYDLQMVRRGSKKLPTKTVQV